MPKPRGMVIPGAWNFSGASRKLMPAINPAQKKVQKTAKYLFISEDKYPTNKRLKSDADQKNKLFSK